MQAQCIQSFLVVGHVVNYGTVKSGSRRPHNETPFLGIQSILNSKQRGNQKHTKNRIAENRTRTPTDYTDSGMHK